MKIIGITGTLGAGKGTIVDYLVQHKGCLHFSVRSYLIAELEKRGWEVNRDSMTLLANELRSLHSPAFIAEELYKEATRHNQVSIIESIRTEGEISLLRNKGDFILLAVDALPEIRYQRVVARNSETDKVSFATFMENEAREMKTSDPNHQNLSRCIELADVLLLNNSNKEDLYKQIEDKLSF